MGFRSTFITEDYAPKYPKWFKDKWKDAVFIGKGTVIASKHEAKTYGLWMDLEEDLQKVMAEWDLEDMILIYLHECGGITRLKITKDKIIYSEPTGWKETEQVEHNYCYGCSDLTLT